MVNFNLKNRNGVVSLFLLFGMALVAVSLPIATKLVQQNQENRSSAASSLPNCGSTNVNIRACLNNVIYKCVSQSVAGSSGGYGWERFYSCESGTVCSEGLCIRMTPT
ncbi:MAG: hypothetical protein EOM05_11415, partial [Clostridia bacterium]|nr:hypothetical protein [Clostridia bacterium]